MSSNTAVFNIKAFRHLIMSEQGKTKTKFAGLLYIIKSLNVSCALCAHSQFVCSRVANSACLKPDFEILAFFEHLWFFWEIKKGRKIRLFLAYFQSVGLALAKHCLSCIFIANLLRRGSITRQGAQNIAKILLLPYK